MWYLRGTSAYGLTGHGWAIDHKRTKDEGVTITFAVGSSQRIPSPSAMLSIGRSYIEEKQETWIDTDGDLWKVNLGHVGTTFIRDTADWLSGWHHAEPVFQLEERQNKLNITNHDKYTIFLTLVIYKDRRQRPMPSPATPIEITESIYRFRDDHPDSSRVAFIVMPFNSSTVYEKITNAIRSTLTSVGIVGLRADDKAYHEDLFLNVQTYLHGCDFGIAVYDRVEMDYFNPNVALEVGYLLALRKNVCFLKDRTLHTIQTDLIGRLYQEFDTHDPKKTIPPALGKWLSDKGKIAQLN